MHKFVYSRQSVLFAFSLSLILSVAQMNTLIAQIVNPGTYNAQLTEMRIRTCGHVRLCLKLWGKSHDYTKSLEVILDKCPRFFATKKRPLLFALSVRKIETSHIEARRHRKDAIKILKKHGFLELLRDKHFRKAVFRYVDEAGMIDKANLHWIEAVKITNSLRDVSCAHACALVSRHINKVCHKVIKEGKNLDGPLGKLLLKELKGLLPPDTGCPGTGSPDYSISSDGTVTCKNHGTYKAAEAIRSPIPSAAMVQYTEKNPFLWALDHVMRIQASKSALSRIRSRNPE